MLTVYIVIKFIEKVNLTVGAITNITFVFV